MPSSQVRLPKQIASASAILEEDATAIRRPSLYRPRFGALAALDTFARQGDVRPSPDGQEIDRRTLRRTDTFCKNATPEMQVLERRLRVVQAARMGLGSQVEDA